jgi:hypothetical protein
VAIDDLYQQRQAELDAQIALLSQSISDLGLKWSVEYNPLLKKQFQQQIQQLEEERQRLDQQKADLLARRLYGGLLPMDYNEPIKAYNACVAQQRAAAFLIHGGRKYGHYWLLNRLQRRKFRPDGEVDLLPPYDLSSTQLAYGLEDIWAALNRDLGLEESDPLPATAAQLADKLAAHSVILRLTNADRWEGGDLPDLVDGFWNPLLAELEKIQQKKDPGGLAGLPNWLVLFIVYHDQKLGPWPKPGQFVPFGSLPAPCQAVLLPRLGNFKIQHIWQGLSNINELLPDPVGDDFDSDPVIAALWDASGEGVPEKVAEQVFKACKVKYSGDEQWLKV